jgi:hypothetical protein
MEGLSSHAVLIGDYKPSPDSRVYVECGILTIDHNNQKGFSTNRQSHACAFRIYIYTANIIQRMEFFMGMSIPSASASTSGVSYIQQQQMKSQMDTMMSSVQTPPPQQVSKPVGNIGNNIDTMA